MGRKLHSKGTADMRVVPISVGILLKFRETVREIDLEEVLMASGKSFDESLLSDYKDAQALIDDEGVVFAIGGIKDHLVWMITTTAIDTHKIKFLRETRKLLKEALKENGYLYNMVYLKNKIHVDWLKWLGCRFLPAYPTPEGFLMFEIGGK